MLKIKNLDLLTIEDLKGRITKFLEDLIEKHPETLDAIENVRMNRRRVSTFQDHQAFINDFKEISIQKEYIENSEDIAT